MKLLFCNSCQDVVKLSSKGKRTCECGQSWGIYTDDLNAIIGGQAIPIGFSNKSLVHALKHRPEYGQGKVFDAFVIPTHCPTIQVEKQEVLTTKKK